MFTGEGQTRYQSHFGEPKPADGGPGCVVSKTGIQGPCWRSFVNFVSYQLLYPNGHETPAVFQQVQRDLF